MSERDLVLHHKMLKQFLEISDDSSNKTRTNSSRAARAREKLLKLSGAQFRELSTDVYDELRRRIDESRGEPDFLLPKSSFHPKRNQARQKLSSLPQSRFKDLVSDISYEIERRNLHVPAVNANNTNTNNNNNNKTNSHNTMSTSSDSRHSNQSFSHNRQQSADVGSHINSFDHSRNVSIGTRGSKEQQQPHQSMQSASSMRQQQHSISESPRGQTDHQPSIGVQSTTVIPSKANLTWSSDEEDDEEDLNGAHDDSFNGVNKRSIVGDTGNGRDANGAGIAAGFASGASAASAVEPVSSKSVAELKELNEKNSQLDTLVNSLQAKLEEAQHDKDHLESKIKLLQEEYDYSNTQNKELSKELEELSSSKNQWLTEKDVYDKKIEDNQLNYIHKTEYETLKSSLGALRLENQSLKNSVSKDRQQRTASTDFASQLQQKQIQLDQGSPTTQISGSANSGAVKKDVERLLEQLGNIDTSRSAVKKGGEQSVIDLKMDVAKWQSKYEEVRSGHISKDLQTKIMKSDDLKPFISPQGSISFKLVADLLAFVETFLNYLDNDDTFDSDFLFEKISKISVTANAIAAQGDDASLNSNENSILLREAVSYALTSTRYYAVYSNILPKVIVERSLGEICFCLCDLISISKLNINEIGDNKYGGGLKVIQKNDEAINSGVRPLRMANRLREQSNLSPTNDRHEIIVPKIIPTQVDNDSNASSRAKGISSLSSRFDRKREEVEPEVTPKPKGTPPRAQIGSGVAYLSKRLSNQAESSPNSSPSRITPTKSNNSIFDKVKQFETSPRNDDYTRGINGSPESLKKVSEEDRGLSGAFRANGSRKDKIEESEPKPVGKGIFQSLREKLVSADNNEDLNNSDEKVDTSVNDTMAERDLNSTNQTTPYNDNHSISSVKSDSGKGFFSSIRQKLGSQENGDIDEDENESETATITPAKELKSSVMNFSKHKVNMVNIDEPKSLGRTQSTDSKADSKASFHSTFQSPQASSKAVDTIAPVKKSVNISPMPAQVAHLNTTYDDDEDDDDEFDDESEEEDPEEEEARQRQEYRKSMAAATFNVDLFDIDDPDNTLTQVLLYLENQTVKVISTTQSLLSAIKHPQVTKDVLRSKAGAITNVISQMTEATNTSMNQTRNAQLKEHGSWVVRSLEDCSHRMNILCKVNPDESDATFADKNFKQRLAGISFDIAKCTKELVKTVEEATLKEEIANLNARLSRQVE